MSKRKVLSPLPSYPSLALLQQSFLTVFEGLYTSSIHINENLFKILNKRQMKRQKQCRSRGSRNSNVIISINTSLTYHLYCDFCHHPIFQFHEVSRHLNYASNAE